MRFSYAEAMGDPTHYIPLAKAAEAAGWDGTVIPDSICYPEHSDTKYPYTPDGGRNFLEGKPFIEPFTLIPAMAADRDLMAQISEQQKMDLGSLFDHLNKTGGIQKKGRHCSTCSRCGARCGARLRTTR